MGKENCDMFTPWNTTQQEKKNEIIYCNETVLAGIH